MSWQGMHISKPSRLWLENKQVCIQQGERAPLSFALEDIAYIVCDTPQIRLSAALLAACAEHGCLLLSTDERHMPNGAFMPFHSYHRQLEAAQAQMLLTKPRKKRIWQMVIQQKLRNQAASLQQAGKQAAATRLHALVQKVKSGDSTNIEALGARLYWQALFDNFVRDYDAEDRKNALLNYGYAIVRAALARQLAALGFLPAFGVHHCNKQNAFNLADDCIEPWRPLVDIWACKHMEKHPEGDTLSLADRQTMVSILNSSALLGNEVYTVLTGIRKQIESLKAYCICPKTEDLILPTPILQTVPQKDDL